MLIAIGVLRMSRKRSIKGKGKRAPTPLELRSSVRKNKAMGSSLGATHSTPNETNDRGGTEAGRKIHKVYFKGSLGKAAIRDAQKKKKSGKG